MLHSCYNRNKDFKLLKLDYSYPQSEHSLTCRLVIRGFRKTLETSDLWLLRKEETVDFNRNVFAPQWEPVMQQWRIKQVELEAKKNQTAQQTNTCTNPRVDILESATGTNGKRLPRPNKSDNGSGAGTDALEMQTLVGDKKEEQEEAAMEKMEEKETQPRPPLVKMLFKVYGPMLLLSQCIVAIYMVAYFCNPLLLWYGSFLKFHNSEHTGTSIVS